MREIVHVQTGQCGNQIGTKAHLMAVRPSAAPARRPSIAACAKDSQGGGAVAALTHLVPVGKDGDGRTRPFGSDNLPHPHQGAVAGCLAYSVGIEEENAPCSDSAESAVGQTVNGRQPSRLLGPQQLSGPGVVAGGSELGTGSILQTAYPGLLSLYRCFERRVKQWYNGTTCALGSEGSPSTWVRILAMV
ncbi:hypothetical protein E2C01_012651 [Portunus trituberculatus]|uniref:Uncharacterized protein n=1 Tax=Portunus trituberculatus TaxID=210409 RepID=A0A5B7DFA5_PORTR|nr:hypothetical protein [Portunus trituberculatus]